MTYDAIMPKSDAINKINQINNLLWPLAWTITVHCMDITHLMWYDQARGAIHIDMCKSPSVLHNITLYINSRHIIFQLECRSGLH